MNKKLNVILNSPGSLELKVFTEFVRNGAIEVVDVLFWDDDSYGKYPLEIRVTNPVPMWESIDSGLSGNFKDVDLSLFSKDIESGLREIESVALEMMERLDKYRNHTYQQRKNLYMYLVCYWLRRIDELKPDVFYTRCAPHEVVDFILFNSCKLSRIKIITFYYTSLPGLHFCGEDYKIPCKLYQISDSSSCREKLNFCKELVSSRLSRPVVAPDYFKKLETEIASALASTGSPSRFGEIVLALKFVFRQILLLWAFLLSSSRGSVGDRIGWLKRMSSFTSVSAHLLFFRGIATEYKTYCKRDRPVKYVYFLLQYQPENTTSPLGGRYNCMALAVATLSKALPDGWLICVKEHPGQFIQNNNYYGYIGRNPSFYKQLASIPNVQIIPTDVNHDEWLNAASCVATITGTVGWEAVLKKKPCIIFGEAWYHGAPGVVRVCSVEDCKKVFERLSVQSNSITDSSIIDFVDQLIRRSVYIYFDAEEAGWHGAEFDFQQNAGRLKAILTEVLYENANAI